MVGPSKNIGNDSEFGLSFKRSLVKAQILYISYILGISVPSVALSATIGHS